jgi:o-succinylbenzoate synthase
VKIARARITPFCLPLRAPLRTAHETLHERRGWLLALESTDGHLGWGDASPIAGFGMEDEKACGEALGLGAQALLGREPVELDALIDEVEALLPAMPGARAALDSALHDLRARQEDRSVASLLAARRGDEPRPSLAVGFLCSGGGLDELVANVRQALSLGFGTFKLKVGAEPLEMDVARARAVRGAIGGGKRLRLDANAAWSTAQAEAALKALVELDVELIEQPVAAADLAALARLRAKKYLPVAADEAACSERDAMRVLEADAADVIVVKPSAVGGLRAAARVADRAAAQRRTVLVTSLLESAVGVCAAAQLAASLPGGRPADGLATSALFERDLAPGPRIADGRLWLPDSPGLGVEPSPMDVAACRRGDPIEVVA